MFDPFEKKKIYIYHISYGLSGMKKEYVDNEVCISKVRSYQSKMSIRKNVYIRPTLIFLDEKLFEIRNLLLENVSLGQFFPLVTFL